MKLHKKAIQLSLQTVVVGIILLIVLGVVLYIFGTNIGKQNEILGNQIEEIDTKEDQKEFIENLITPSENEEPSTNQEIGQESLI